jgi:hypothetical protein
MHLFIVAGERKFLYLNEGKLVIVLLTLDC